MRSILGQCQFSNISVLLSKLDLAQHSQRPRIASQNPGHPDGA